MRSANGEMEALEAAIEALYRAFERYPLRPYVDGCGCCVTPKDHARIHSRPLRELRVDDLRHCALSALWTWGDEDDFRHFLPRILELIALDDLGTNPEIVVGKPATIQLLEDAQIRHANHPVTIQFTLAVNQLRTARAERLHDGI